MEDNNLPEQDVCERCGDVRNECICPLGFLEEDEENDDPLDEDDSAEVEE